MGVDYGICNPLTMQSITLPLALEPIDLAKLGLFASLAIPTRLSKSNIYEPIDFDSLLWTRAGSKIINP